MTTPEDPWAKEPLEEGGEKLTTEEPGKSTEKKGRREEGEREEDPLLEFQGKQGSRWLYHQSSSSSDDDDHLTPWDLLPGRGQDPIARRFGFKRARYYRESLLKSLRMLGRYQLWFFLRKLREIPLEEGFVRIPEEALHKAGASRLGNLLLSYYGVTYSAEVAAKALRAIDCKHEADRLLFSARECMQTNDRKRKVWSMKGVAVTAYQMVCKDQ